MLASAALPAAAGSCLASIRVAPWQSSQTFGSGARELATVRIAGGYTGTGHRYAKQGGMRVRAVTAEEYDLEGQAIAEDYYSILGLVRSLQ